jgi:hypothetical protein
VPAPPVDSIVALRAYLRHQETLVPTAGIHIQRMQRPSDR